MCTELPQSVSEIDSESEIELALEAEIEINPVAERKRILKSFVRM